MPKPKHKLTSDIAQTIICEYAIGTNPNLANDIAQNGVAFLRRENHKSPKNEFAKTKQATTSHRLPTKIPKLRHTFL